MTSLTPVLFVGHGSPLNAIEDNPYSQTWQKLANRLPKPKAILAISAHWYTDTLAVCPDPQPRQIFDMYGFPPQLYQLKYTPAGSPQLAETVRQIAHPQPAADSSWGLDHGSWSVLSQIYPQADVPVVQLSVSRTLNARQQYELGVSLQSLRREGILIFASGDVVHNLSRVDWDLPGGYDWADDFDRYIRDRILANDHEAVIDYASYGSAARLSVPTPEHFLPLLTALGAAGRNTQITVFNDARTLGSISMTGYLFQ